jgi:uncharacterized membrane protein
VTADEDDLTTKADKTAKPSESDGTNLSQDQQPHQPVPAGLGEVLRREGIDPSDPKTSRVLEISMMIASGSSALPPAFTVEPWEHLYPGISRKFVEWTEVQSAHRRYIEKQRADRSEARQDRSQTFTVTIAIVGLSLATIVGVWGNPWVAGVIATVAVGGPAAAVAIANRGRSASPASKRKSP